MGGCNSVSRTPVIKTYRDEHDNHYTTDTVISKHADKIK
jgi:hypothetical protein